MKAVKNIRVDVNKQDENIAYVYAKKDDAASRCLNITLINDGEKLLVENEGVTPILNIKRSDGVYVSLMCEVLEDGTLYVSLTNTALEVIGEAECEIAIFSKDSDRLTSANFKIFIADRVLSDDPIISSNEFSALNEALGKIDETCLKLQEEIGVEVDRAREYAEKSEDYFNDIKNENRLINYEKVENKPMINGVELLGNKTFRDLGLNPSGTYLEEFDPTVPEFVKNIKSEDINRWNEKFGKDSVVPVANGGTGATSASKARKTLGVQMSTYTSLTDAVPTYTDAMSLEEYITSMPMPSIVFVEVSSQSAMWPSFTPSGSNAYMMIERYSWNGVRILLTSSNPSNSVLYVGVFHKELKPTVIWQKVVTDRDSVLTSKDSLVDKNVHTGVVTIATTGSSQVVTLGFRPSLVIANLPGQGTTMIANSQTTSTNLVIQPNGFVITGYSGDWAYVAFR